MLNSRPSARLRVATSSSSLSFASPSSLIRTTSMTGAPDSSTITLETTCCVRSSITSSRQPRSLVSDRTRATWASGFSTPSSVTRKLPATASLPTSCPANA